MKVATLLGSIGQKGGGVSKAAHNLVNGLRSHCEAEQKVFSVWDEFATQERLGWDGIDISLARAYGPSSFSWCPALRQSVESFAPDLVHQHGVWQWLSVVARQFPRRIISPHGMLDEWALSASRMKKLVALKLFEWENLRSAACLHALCDAEYLSLRKMGLKNPVCVIPNGLDLKGFDPSLPCQPTRPHKQILFLGRIHPKKGLNELLHAWKILERGKEVDGWHLRIIGWGEAKHVSELKQLLASLELHESVDFSGPRFGEEKKRCFLESDGFILPSKSEGLPMAVLEAWASALPVLITPQCNLPEGYRAGAALEISCDEQGIAEKIRQFVEMPGPERVEIGKKGRELVLEKFSPTAVAGQMAAVYSWLAGGGQCPDCVRN